MYNPRDNADMSNEIKGVLVWIIFLHIIRKRPVGLKSKSKSCNNNLRPLNKMMRLQNKLQKK